MQYASQIRQVVSGAQRLPDTRRPTDLLTLLDRVEDRDRAILAMLLEHTHPDDIAATVGISAAALKRRRAHIVARAGDSLPTDELDVPVRSTSP